MTKSTHPVLFVGYEGMYFNALSVATFTLAFQCGNHAPTYLNLKDNNLSAVAGQLNLFI